jgi:hypothetical protein
MKYKYGAALVAVVVTTVSLAAVTEKRTSGQSVFLLKSGGATIAELRVQAAATVSIESTNPSGYSEYNRGSGLIVARGGAILRLTTGTNSISVRADEIESVADSKER